MPRRPVLRALLAGLALTALPGPAFADMRITEPTDASVVYVVPVDPAIAAGLRDDPAAIAERYRREFLEAVARDIDAGLVGDRRPVLRLTGPVGDAAEHALYTALVMEIVRGGADAEALPGVIWRAEGTFSPQYEQAGTRFRDPTREEAAALDAMRDLWPQLRSVAADAEGVARDGDALANAIIRLAIADAAYLDAAIAGLGVWLGDALVSGHGYRWAHATDMHGAVLCVRTDGPDGGRYIDPFGAVKKRLVNQETFDARGLVEILSAM